MEKSKSFPAYKTASLEAEFDPEGPTRSYTFNGPHGKGLESSADRDQKRKRRVAGYNVLSMERKFKSSLKNGFKWVKTRLTV